MSVVSSSRVLGELEFIVTEIKECLPIKYIGSDFYLVFFFHYSTVQSTNKILCSLKRVLKDILKREF